jgi:hypothetical protein
MFSVIPENCFSCRQLLRNAHKLIILYEKCQYYVSLGVSICLDVVLIETLDLDAKKVSVST